MLRAIELGKNALGTAAPNPMVGCVIIHENSIIGEGFTSPFGGPHAEVNAINSVKDKSLLTKATLYVTLEPCSHFGKTPPCADLILKHKIKKVMVGLLDPNEKVAGKGIQKLKDAGCKVEVGILQAACREHHKRFLSLQEKKRPYIILKWAETADGFIAPNPQKRNHNPEPYWITNTKSRQLVHKWRSEEMAILVGTTTVLDDNPKLNTRDWAGKSPVRIVLDKSLKITRNFNVFDDAAETIILTEIEKVSELQHVVYHKIDFERNMAEQICDTLFKHHISSVLIEGGSKMLQTFINANLWDEARIFKGLATFGEGISSPLISGKLTESKNLLNDTLTLLKND